MTENGMSYISDNQQYTTFFPDLNHIFLAIIALNLWYTN